MTDDVTLTLDGKDVSPETVDARDLAYILENLARAVREVAYAAGDSPESVQMSLTSVVTGSSGYTFTANNPGRAHTATVVSAIELGDGTALPFKARKCLSAIHGRIRKHNWTLEIAGKTQSGHPYRTLIRPKARLFDAPRIWGDTSILATIIKAGGESGRRIAEIRMTDGSHFTAKVSTVDLAKRLGKLLYEQVELHGKAIWNAESNLLDTFTITSIGPYRKDASNPPLALEQLSKLTQGHWDTIDVASYLKELRGDDGVGV